MGQNFMILIYHYLFVNDLIRETGLGLKETRVVFWYHLYTLAVLSGFIDSEAEWSYHMIDIDITSVLDIV